MTDLKERVQRRLGERKKHSASPAPRYDAIFYAGLAWLNSLAGEPPSSEKEREP